MYRHRNRSISLASRTGIAVSVKLSFICYWYMQTR